MGGKKDKISQTTAVFIRALAHVSARDHGPDVLYEIGKDPVVGRFMVAARDVEAGEVIFTDEPACIGELPLF